MLFEQFIEREAKFRVSTLQEFIVLRIKESEQGRFKFNILLHLECNQLRKLKQSGFKVAAF